MKRLPELRAAHPEIDIELVSREQNDAHVTEAADVVIVFDTPDALPGIRRASIIPETRVAVA